MEENFETDLNEVERIRCLEKISQKIVRSIYIFEMTIKDPEKYDYKEYVKNILVYVKHADKFFDGHLMDVKVTLNGVLDYDYDKTQYKTIVFECKNYVDYLLRQIDEGEQI